MASALFSPIKLRGLELANRIVVSPMCQYHSDNGTANDWHLMHLGQFSLGAGALVMTEAPYAPKYMPCHPKLRPQVFPNRKAA